MRKKYGGTGLLSKKTKALYAELNKSAEVANNHQKIRSRFMNLLSQILLFKDINHGYRAAILKKNYLWLLPFYMAVATYCYYEKVRRMMRTANVSYLLH